MSDPFLDRSHPLELIPFYASPPLLCNISLSSSCPSFSPSLFTPSILPLETRKFFVEFQIQNMKLYNIKKWRSIQINFDNFTSLAFLKPLSQADSFFAGSISLWLGGITPTGTTPTYYEKKKKQWKMPVFENTAPSTQYLKKLSSTTKAPNEVCSILTLRHV